jgi:hypothetical protein
MAWKAIGTIPKLALAMAVMLAGVATGLETGAEAKAAKKKDPSKRVCQTIRPSGTRLVQRVCFTQQELEDHARATQDSLLEHQRKNTSTNGLTSFHAGNPN